MSQNKGSQGRLKVLSLEDSAMDYDIIRERLISEGYKLEMLRVDTESEFTSQLSQRQFDLVLSDFSLPGFDAYHALRICNEICPDIPFICISGAIGEETAIDLLKLGATDIVMKDKLDRLPFVFSRALAEMKEKKGRKIAEADLSSSETRFRHISSTISDISYSCLMAPEGSYSIDWMTGSAEKVTGFTIGEIIAMKCWGNLIIAEDADRFHQNILDLQPGSSSECELRLRHKKGNIIWAHSFAECIKDEKTPGKQTIYGAIVDITRRKAAEENLQNSEKKYRSLVENALIGIYTTTLNGTMLFANRAMCEMLEYQSPEEFLRTDVSSTYLKSGEREKFVSRITREKQLFNYEVDLVTKKGNVRNVIVNAFVTGEVITGMIMDISARKHAEKELTDKMEDLQRFHNLTVGRELSMIELKKEVNELLKKSGHQEKYKIVG